MHSSIFIPRKWNVFSSWNFSTQQNQMTPESDFHGKSFGRMKVGYFMMEGKRISSQVDKCGFVVSRHSDQPDTSFFLKKFKFE